MEFIGEAWWIWLCGGILFGGLALKKTGGRIKFLFGLLACIFVAMLIIATSFNLIFFG